MQTVQLRETAAVAEAAAATAKSGRMMIQLINPGWGSSGYYSADVLEAAADARVFPAGTHMYLDHPTATQEAELPERSVRDLAAVLTTDAVWTGEALVGEATVFGPYREVIAEMKDAIGVSIRGSARVSEGEREGRRGRVVEELVQAASVDFVTRAGRGGRVLEVLESARTAMEEAVANGDVTVPDSPTDVPTTRSDSTTTTESQKENLMGKIEIDESEHTRLVDLAGRVEALEAERDTEKARADQAEKDLAEAKRTTSPRSPREVMEARDKDLRTQVATLTARERARDIIGEELAEAWLPPTTVARLSGELIESLPLVGDDLKLDEQALRNRVIERRNQHELEAAEALNAAGVGVPRGLSALRTAPAAESTAITESIKGSLTAFGLSESEADIAAKGR
ncbi:hypothetical protein GON03_19075 [Nocardioides sp. MAH-18]|uniref:Uncharacterized protein n=1 Tax=Nocardioides agri TaxID=2682843 RepID=A0A6L6XVS6_9ACTN|nr:MULTISPECIES: hypothetical protein [unclassified Nocardioides]MBA2952120.1 hypothetical protein [Nocardioides sp. CGMCC 1.13656]MVQ51289.1 hypothetical protein [Nocardioides sp. MAH-18]